MIHIKHYFEDLFGKKIDLIHSNDPFKFKTTDYKRSNINMIRDFSHFQKDVVDSCEKINEYVSQHTFDSF